MLLWPSVQLRFCFQVGIAFWLARKMYGAAPYTFLAVQHRLLLPTYINYSSKLLSVEVLLYINMWVLKPKVWTELDSNSHINLWLFIFCCLTTAKMQKNYHCTNLYFLCMFMKKRKVDKFTGAIHTII